MKGKTIFLLSLFILLYLAFLVLHVEFLKIELTILRVIQEAITLPILIGQLYLLILAFLDFRRNNYSLRTYAFWSLVVLTTSTVFVLASFVLD